MALWLEINFSTIQQNCVYPRQATLHDSINNVPTKFELHSSDIHQETKLKLPTPPQEAEIIGVIVGTSVTEPYLVNYLSYRDVTTIRVKLSSLRSF